MVINETNTIKLDSSIIPVRESDLVSVAQL